MIKQHGAMSADTRVADQFEAVDLGAPFKVILHKAVRVEYDETGKTVSYNIPDLEGLLRAIVTTRILIPRRLSGAEIKFIRRAVAVKQKDMAPRIGMSPEHLSRCEASALVMSPTSEKLLRIFALKTAIKLHKFKPCDAMTKLETALDCLFDDVKPVAVFDVNDPLVLHFSRTRPGSNDNEDDDTVDVGEWDAEQSKLIAA